MTRDGRLLRAGVLAALLLGIAGPVALGLWETARAAFGLLPAIGADRLSLEAWAMLAAMPGLGTSLRLTLVTGFGATVLSLLLALGAAARSTPARGWPRGFSRPSSPRPMPRSPSGSPSSSRLRAGSRGRCRPGPRAGTCRRPRHRERPLGRGADPRAHGQGGAVPPVVLLVALNQAARGAAGRGGAGDGLRARGGLARVILPQAYPLIRLPVFAVLAYSLSVVDMAVILGPSNPPTLAVAVTRWAFAPDTAMLLPAAAAALAAGADRRGRHRRWIGAERLAARAGRWWLRRGGRGGGDAGADGRHRAFRRASRARGAGAPGAGALVGHLAVELPERAARGWSTAAWARHGPAARETLLTTLAIGAAATLAALALAIAWLEGEDRARRGRARTGPRC
jgi:putative thiamine transport system permease protein